MASNSSILAWEIPCTKELGRLHTVHGVTKSQTGLETDIHTYIHTHTHTHPREQHFMSFQITYNFVVMIQKRKNQS